MVVKAPPFREAPPTKKPSMLGCCPDQRRPDPSFSWRFASFHKKGTSCCSTNYQNEISPMPKSIEVSRKRTTANFKQNHMLLLVTAFSSPPNMFIFHQLRPLNLSSFDEIIQPHPSIFDRSKHPVCKVQDTEFRCVLVVHRATILDTHGLADLPVDTAG